MAAIALILIAGIALAAAACAYPLLRACLG